MTFHYLVYIATLGRSLEKGIDKKHYPPITYEYAQEEIAAKAGINIQRFEKHSLKN